MKTQKMDNSSGCFAPVKFSPEMEERQVGDFVSVPRGAKAAIRNLISVTVNGLPKMEWFQMMGAGFCANQVTKMIRAWRIRQANRGCMTICGEIEFR